FHAALIAEVRAHPTLTETWNPKQRAARGGYLATRLFVEAAPALAMLETAIRAAIDGLKAALSDDAQHPFLMRKPARYALDAWCNILVADGHQAPHIHNLGWLSGVYYVRVPPQIGDRDPAGWIEFGRPGYGLPETPAMTLRTVRPREGLAVMFPSYVWHRTIAFVGEGERISIAFDLHAKG
ncbi:MAG: 2OG-Fe(II) oxygenase family protein, partial [Alphaproteobacteria bacterium]